ncbi:MAG: RHS repeat-associated core domain-containing protein, partial [Pyrinomonadaceae bacterium]
RSKKNANSGFFNYADTFTYNSAGAVTKMQLGNGHWETYQYNTRQQITQIGLGTTDVQTDLLKLEYNYGTSTQNNGSMLEQKITVPTTGGNSGFTAIQTYAYDSINRLQSAQETVSNAQTWKQTFQYDRYGNRRFDTTSNNTTTLGSCATAICNPLINTSDNRFSPGQGYQYDANGNLTVDSGGKQFLYDAENHQKEVKDQYGNTVGLYLYDGDGKRVKKLSLTETTVFVYNAKAQLVAEYSTQSIEQPQVAYITTDHLNSPRAITDAGGSIKSRKDYMAFGEQTATAQRTENLGYQPPNVRQGYTGYEKDDESGLDFAQARYYNSVHGRYTSIDPLTASADIKNPQTFNRYSYVLNSPYKLTDPLGLISQGTGANGKSDNLSGKECDLECRLNTGQLKKSDYVLLQWHVANGTALGYTLQNALQKSQQQSQSQQEGDDEDPSTSVKTLSGKRLKQKAGELAKILNAAFQKEAALLRKYAKKYKFTPAVVKELFSQLAKSFDPQGSIGIPSGGSISIDPPSLVTPLIEGVASYADAVFKLQDDLVDLREDTVKEVDTFMGDLTIDMIQNEVSDVELLPVQENIMNKGIELFNKAKRYSISYQYR